MPDNATIVFRPPANVTAPINIGEAYFPSLYLFTQHKIVAISVGAATTTITTKDPHGLTNGNYVRVVVTDEINTNLSAAFVCSGCTLTTFTIPIVGVSNNTGNLGLAGLCFDYTGCTFVAPELMDAEFDGNVIATCSVVQVSPAQGEIQLLNLTAAQTLALSPKTYFTDAWMTDQTGKRRRLFKGPVPCTGNTTPL